jgi:hypothetical protein
MSTSMDKSLAAAESGRSLTRGQALALAEGDDAGRLTALAERLCVAGHGTRVTFSKKVFIPGSSATCATAHLTRTSEAVRHRAVLIARAGQRPVLGRRCSRSAIGGAALCGRAPGAG